MRVIEEGTPQPWTVKVRCTGKGNRGEGCGSLMEASASDLFVTESHALGETETSVTVQCPVCSIWTDLPDRNVPTWVQAELRRRLASTEPIRND